MNELISETRLSTAQRLRNVPGMQQLPDPRVELFILRDFLDRAECSALIALIDANRRPSTLANYTGEPGFRTSETCDFDPEEPAVAALNAKLTDLSGIDPVFGERLQGQRYEEGQEFKAHTDFFEPGAPDYDEHCAKSGQRTWTFMIYLNDVPLGGVTRFKTLKRSIRPERGKLLAWNNRLPDGGLNAATIHHAMKVRKGVKHIITRWYREHPWA